MKIYDMKDDKGIGFQVEASLCDNDMHLIIVVCKHKEQKDSKVRTFLVTVQLVDDK